MKTLNEWKLAGSWPYSSPLSLSVVGVNVPLPRKLSCLAGDKCSRPHMANINSDASFEILVHELAVERGSECIVDKVLSLRQQGQCKPAKHVRVFWNGFQITCVSKCTTQANNKLEKSGLESFVNQMCMDERKKHSTCVMEETSWTIASLSL